MKMRYQTIGKVIPIVLAMVFVFSIFNAPIKVNAAAPFISAAVKVATNGLGSGGVFVSDEWGNLGTTQYSCFMNGYWYVVYPSAATPLVFRYSYSTDGITWVTDLALFTTQNNANQKGWGLACNPSGSTGSPGLPGAGTIAIGYIDFGTVPYGFYNFFVFTAPNAFTKNFANDAGVALPTAAMSATPSLAYDAGGNFIFDGIRQSNGAEIEVFFNGTYDHSITITGIGMGEFVATSNGAGIVGASGALNNALYYSQSVNNYVPNIVYAKTLFPMSGTSTHNTGGQPTFLSQFQGGGAGTILYPYSQGTGTNNGHCSIETFNTNTGAFTNTVVSGQSTVCGYAGNYNAQQWAVSDSSSQTIWLLYGNQVTSINQIVYSSDNGNTFGVASYAPGPTDTVGFSGIAVNNAAQSKQALAVETDFSGNIWAQLFSSALPVGISNQTQTIGSCPAKDTSTVKLANNTLYYYQATVTGIGESVNTVLGFSATVYNLGSTNFIIYEAVYVTPAVGGVSVTNPLTLQSGGSHAFSLSPGSTNQVLQFAPSIPAMTTGQTVAVALLGSDRFTMNQSTLAGMNKVTTSGLTLPGTITSQTSVATQLYLCAIATFQSVITTTSTKTITTGGGSSTQLINAPAPTTSAFWFLIIFYLLIPAVIFMLVGSLPYIASLRREGG